jgi:hypothetical protein
MLSDMSYTPEQWQSIETQARKLGASEDQIRKWRERGGVAATWHAKLIKSDRKLLAAFARETAA